MKVKTIVMTQAQLEDFQKHEDRLQMSLGVHSEECRWRLFGCKVLVSDVPRWCVDIREEW